MLESGIPSRFTVRYLWVGYSTNAGEGWCLMAYIPRALAICYIQVSSFGIWRVVRAGENLHDS